jgi:flagellar motor switch protein FliG
VSTPDLHKAAVLLMSLPEDDAARIISRLDPKQVELVTVEIARMKGVTSDEQETVIRQFADANPNALAIGGGGIDAAKSLVEKALGKNAEGTLNSVRQQIEALPFGFLSKVDSQNLLAFIADEHPQTIALIVSHLPANQAAEIVKGLATERQLAVIRRVAVMGQTNPEIIKEVERGLENRMSSLMNQSYQKAGGVPKVAQILNVIDRATERALMETLAQDDGPLVEEIRRLMFIFEDILRLDNKQIQTLLKNVETAQWAMALKGASPELKQKILGNMSQRAGEMLSEEIEFLGAVKRSSVEQAQQQIVDIVRMLEDSGQITIQSGEEEEQLVQ